MDRANEKAAVMQRRRDGSSFVGFVLSHMTKDELRTVADFYGVARSGTKATIAERISEHVEGNLSSLISPRGPWLRNDWNTFVQDALGGQRRRSFEEIREEVRRIHADLEEARVVLGRDLLGASVALVLRQERVDELATLVGLNPRVVARRLRRAHGNKQVRHLFALEIPPELTVTDGIRTVNERYIVLRSLGKGGFGTAYEARDTRNPIRKRVVLKFGHLKEDEAFLERELVKAFDLSHRNICRYYDLDQETTEDDRVVPFLVIEYGGDSLESLFERLGTDERFSQRFAFRVVKQVAAALDYASESHHIVHGDINPGNILVGDDEVVRLSDFGLASRLEVKETSGGHRTMVGSSVLGHHQVYSAPEVLAGRSARRSSDQYSLAVVFCAMMEGTLFDTPYRQRQFAFLSRKQNAALERALELDPRNRFSTCTAFSRALCTP
jgi:hypothetical protein